MFEFENGILETTKNFTVNFYYLSCKRKLGDLYE